MRTSERTVAVAQGGYYVATGLWPLLDRRSFEHVTGPKTEFWLVKTVGVLVLAVGVGLAQAARRGGPMPPELRLVAIGSAAGLAAIDAAFALRGRISRVYLADAAVEIGLLVVWAEAARGRSGR
jgi:hypothetical protein